MSTHPHTPRKRGKRSRRKRYLEHKRVVFEHRVLVHQRTELLAAGLRQSVVQLLLVSAEIHIPTTHHNTTT
jgi:hypothetical protein